MLTSRVQELLKDLEKWRAAKAEDTIVLERLSSGDPGFIQLLVENTIKDVRAHKIMCGRKIKRISDKIEKEFGK